MSGTGKHNAVSVARYLDSVVEVLRSAGIAVVEVDIDLVAAAPVRAQLVTSAGRVLRWREDLGWSTGARVAEPVSHPSEVARLAILSDE
ncbi:hypothetical protein FHS29_005103 [Saccharothrix tamanrassetensis]|uniref:Uncharacterized protein n=1 Tax=Saccharothrix tamanrassetensis TaxID=1051531 RepID=A0A841CR96_9PSEU|nr:hypothetical protein [Saccharothrix tamanrassetensis]MBB5958495.1 hypothetical protein [Saccharothrix tamanrassetensis]